MPAIRPTTFQVQVKIFEAAGCQYLRTQGDHLVYSYPEAVRPVVIPRYKEVKVIVKSSLLSFLMAFTREWRGKFVIPVPKVQIF